MILFYTALFGRQTKLKEFDTTGLPFYCFTDDPELTSNTWTIIQQPRRGSPRRDAKWYKMNPDTLGLPLNGLDRTIWIDASITPTAVKLMVEACGQDDLALFQDPEYTNIYDEAVASIAMPKYAGEPIQAQVEAYRASGLPEHKMFAGGVIARRVGAYPALGPNWYFQTQRWSTQDQLSLPYVLWRLRIEPSVIPGCVYGTDFHKHTWTGPNR